MPNNTTPPTLPLSSARPPKVVLKPQNIHPITDIQVLVLPPSVHDAEKAQTCPPKDVDPPNFTSTSEHNSNRMWNFSFPVILLSNVWSRAVKAWLNTTGFFFAVYCRIWSDENSSSAWTRLAWAQERNITTSIFFVNLTALPFRRYPWNINLYCSIACSNQWFKIFIFVVFRVHSVVYGLDFSKPNCNTYMWEGNHSL